MRQALILVIAILLAAQGGTLAADASEPVAIRFRFGMKDKEGSDWSGQIATSGSGKVESIRGWRWMPGDHADGANFTVATRRQQAQSRGDRQRVAAGKPMPMTDNGIVVTLSGVKEDDQITFDSKVGKVSFKLADLPFGKRQIELDEN